MADPHGQPACHILHDDGAYVLLFMRSYIDEGKSDHRHFRFAINRLSSIKKVPTLSVAEPDGFAIRLVDLLRSNPAYTPTVCDYLSAARFDDQTAKAIARLLSDDPLCVYEWQNYRLWLLAAQHGLRFESLLTKARDTINGPTDGPDKSGAMIYIGSVGDSVDHEIIRRDFRNQNHSLSTMRALCVAMQGLEVPEREVLFTDLADEEGSIGLLAAYLLRLPGPAYVARPRRVTIRRLPDVLPDDAS